MKLNNDCVRDILLTLEEICNPEQIFTYHVSETIPERLSAYSHLEIRYHLKQCHMADLIVGFKSYDNGKALTVTDLSPVGHAYLANIRSNTIWGKTKKIASELGANSLNSMVQISSQIVTTLIKSHFGIA